MNIGFVGRVSFPEGLGATRRFFDIFGRLTELGHAVHLIKPDIGPTDGLLDAVFRLDWRYSRELQRGVTVHSLSRELTMFSQPITVAHFLVELIESERLDVLVLGAPEPYAGIPCLLARKISGIPLVVDYPDSNYITTDPSKLSVFGRFGKFVERRIPPRAEMTLPISETMSRELLSDVSEERKRVLRPGVQFEKIASGTPGCELVPDGFVVGYLGSYAEREGVTELVDTVGGLQEDIPDIHLVMAGGSRGPNSDFVEKSVPPELDSHFTEIDFVNHDDLPDFLASCDVLCAPQRNTFGHRVAFSTKVCEFLASESPLVTTPVGDLATILKDGQHALLVEPGNSEELSGAIRKLHDSANLRSDLGAGGQALAREEFNADVQREKAERILARLINDQ